MRHFITQLPDELEDVDFRVLAPDGGYRPPPPHHQSPPPPQRRSLLNTKPRKGSLYQGVPPGLVQLLTYYNFYANIYS